MMSAVKENQNLSVLKLSRTISTYVYEEMNSGKLAPKEGLGALGLLLHLSVNVKSINYVKHSVEPNRQLIRKTGKNEKAYAPFSLAFKSMVNDNEAAVDFDGRSKDIHVKITRGNMADREFTTKKAEEAFNEVETWLG
jgi:hypothetical protein